MKVNYLHHNLDKKAFIFPKNEKVLICQEIFNQVCVLANGDVVCSCRDYNGMYIVGNIYQNRIYKIFHNEKYTQLRDIVLNSNYSCYCSQVKGNCVFKKRSSKSIQNELKELTIKKIQLETISNCNLNCPICEVSNWKRNKSSRLAKLSFETIKELIYDVKNSLTYLSLFNYGEPFLDDRLLDILRYIKEVVPRAYVYIHTNGNFIPDNWKQRIIEEHLIDEISFSIDGASQQTYEKYRVGGQFERAFNNMADLVNIKNKLGISKHIGNYLKDIVYRKNRLWKFKPYIIWQYILFEWNDSPEEIAKAQKLAKDLGIDIVWIITHSNGKSKRFNENTEEYHKLWGIKNYSSEVISNQIERKIVNKS
ncbi:MAG: radical SAM protein [Candidatus Methanoperedens sp.]|nr:radical SAM protein [Candidatus Methanoperedens sp.]CAG0995522.1 S-adenosyl-L-methionine-dependent 2-deoxy-scyllo-inosamine dehydrogenase [Methanosarcinales archaeon]